SSEASGSFVTSLIFGLSYRVPNPFSKACYSASLSPSRAFGSYVSTYITPLGNIPSRRAVVTTDASLTGWGAFWEGRTVRGTWNSRWRGAHINVQELGAVHLD